MYTQRIKSVLVCGVVICCTHTAYAENCIQSGQRRLFVGSRGEEVRLLQQFLRSESGAPLPTNGIFGRRTEKALVQFQKKYRAEIYKGTEVRLGALDQQTAQFIHAACTTQLPKVQSPPIKAALQISETVLASRAIPAGALRVPFTTASLVAQQDSVAISSVTVRRTGLGSDGAFESVLIQNDSGETLSDEVRLNSLHMAKIPLELVIQKGESFQLTIAANIAEELTDYEGQMPSFAIEAVEATTSVNGLPITGAAHHLVSTLAIGSMDFARSPYDPAHDRTVYVNDENILFSAVRVTAGGAESLLLGGISWEQNGTSGTSDIKNVRVSVNNRTYPTIVEGREYSATFGNGITIEKGYGVDIKILGDIGVTGSYRTVQFDLPGADAVTARGSSYGFYVGGKAGSHTATSGNAVFLTIDGTTSGDSLTPFYRGSAFVISPGAFTSITK
jgi:hypothetical protein